MKKKILIVEDDPGVQDICKIVFQRAGYETCIYANGMEVMQNKYEKPDVFVLDKQLSGSSGLDLCRYLKEGEDTKDIPVLMISASPDIGALYKQSGADDYIEKPFTMKDILQKVSVVLSKK